MTDQNLIYDELNVRTKDGLSLYVRKYSETSGAAETRLPVVCLPGLTRNSRDFHQFAELISHNAVDPRTVYTIDSRGRGNSDWDSDPSHYNLLVEADDVVTVCASLGIERAAFVGTSRGGLILHLLTGIKPDLLGAVVLNDIGPAIGLEGLRQIQTYLGKARPVSSMEEAAAELEKIHGINFPALAKNDWVEMAHALYSVRNGVFAVDFDPAIAEQMRNVDLSVEGPTLWPQFALLGLVPAMVIRGQTSLLLTPKTLSEMQSALPDLQSLEVPGQGHAPILHHQDVFPALQLFLKQCP